MSHLLEGLLDFLGHWHVLDSGVELEVERVPEENGSNLGGKLEEEQGDVLTGEKDGRVIAKEEEEKVDGSLGVAELVAQKGWSQRLGHQDLMHTLGKLHQRWFTKKQLERGARGRVTAWHVREEENKK